MDFSLILGFSLKAKLPKPHLAIVLIEDGAPGEEYLNENWANW